MLSASIAEWILSRLSTRDRAMTMVGDLIEIDERRGLLWFWISVVGVILSLVRRRILAFVAAFFVGSWAMRGFTLSTTGKHMHGVELTMFVVLALAGYSLWASSLYSAILYGVRNMSTQLSLAYTALVTGMIYSFQRPMLMVACVAAAMAAALASTLNRKLRKAALIILLDVAIGYITIMLPLAVEALDLYQSYLQRAPLENRQMRNHPLMGWIYIATVILSLWASTRAWSRIHGWLIPSELLPAEMED